MGSKLLFCYFGCRLTINRFGEGDTVQVPEIETDKMRIDNIPGSLVGADTVGINPAMLL